MLFEKRYAELGGKVYLSVSIGLYVWDMSSSGWD